MKDEPDIISLGEILIDLVSKDKGETFRRKAGGAPANVAAACSKLGLKAGFIGKVGSDEFGPYLKEELEKHGVGTSNLLTGEKGTTLAFAWVDEDGERRFTFRRSADAELRPEEIDRSYISKADVFHFGSISLISEPIRSATLEAVKIAEDKNLTITYDPNYRPDLWDDEDEAREKLLEGLKMADVVKISGDEAEFLYGSGPSEAMDDLLKSATRAFVSLGKEGCYYGDSNQRGHKVAYKVKAKDTTGAGDGFMGGVIYGSLQDWKIDKIASFANAAGGLAATKIGAIPSLPTLDEVMEIWENS